MQATAILMQEHRVIEQVLSCLDAMLVKAGAGKGLSAEDAGEAIGFFREFADHCHHGKEETHLFAMMEANGFPHNGGPVAVMLAEHEQGRAALRGMESVREAAAAGDAAALREFVRMGHAYVELLRQHIAKEDHCLFPMADNALSDPAVQRELLQRFERAESEHMGAGTHERWIGVADALAARYRN